MNNTRKTINEIRALGIPPLYAQENASDPVVYAELHLLGHNWRWFVTVCDIDGENNEIKFCGFVCGFENEWGYFSLSELERAQTKILLANNKLYPAPFSVVKKELGL